MTFAVRYGAWLYPSLQLGDVPMALSPFLQLFLLSIGKPGMMSAGRNSCGSAPSRVVHLRTATSSASMPTKANAGYGSPAQQCSVRVPLWTESSLQRIAVASSSCTARPSCSIPTMVIPRLAALYCSMHKRALSGGHQVVESRGFSMHTWLRAASLMLVSGNS